MGSIVTFYSYKGGVGRSMALANIAVLLARRGLKVLTVDWDLEAPGLEKYFSIFDLTRGGPGLLRMCMEACNGGESPDFRNFTGEIHCDAPHPITFLPSGREQDEEYSKNLETFDWDHFYSLGGGDFLEKLRDRWKAEFDIVLIDSRTGLSDSGGICTIHLPDAVVAVFTANYQSMYGVRDVMRLAQEARRRLAYDRMPLTVLPVASRWGTSEVEESNIWLDRVVEAVGEFFEDWLPKDVSPRAVLDGTKIPHHDYLCFGERLSVFEPGGVDRTGLRPVYEKLAAFLASDFQEMAALGGTPLEKATPPKTKSRSDGYEYDIFLSYVVRDIRAHPVIALIQECVGVLESRLGRRVRLFTLGLEPISEGAVNFVMRGLGRSRALVALISSAYYQNRMTQAEFSRFSQRSRTYGASQILAILLEDPPYSSELDSYPTVNLRNKRVLRSARDRVVLVKQLADKLQPMIENAPPFDPRWPEPPAG